MDSIREYGACLIDKELMPTAFKVALVIGTLLFSINHGATLLKGEMTRDRWISGGITYIVPYMVNIHGQYVSGRRQRTR